MTQSLTCQVRCGIFLLWHMLACQVWVLQQTVFWSSGWGMLNLHMPDSFRLHEFCPPWRRWDSWAHVQIQNVVLVLMACSGGYCRGLLPTSLDLEAWALLCFLLPLSRCLCSHSAGGLSWSPWTTLGWKPCWSLLWRVLHYGLKTLKTECWLFYSCNSKAVSVIRCSQGFIYTSKIHVFSYWQRLWLYKSKQCCWAECFLV